MSKVLVVCATNWGGHIEHAINLAYGFAQSGNDVSLITRADDGDPYPPLSRAAAEMPVLRIPNYTSTGRVRRLLLENMRIAREVRASGADIVLFEESRYPLAILAAPSAIAFIHNSRPHSSGLRRLVDLVLIRLVARLASIVGTHGEAQGEDLRSAGIRHVVTVPLPSESHFRAPGMQPPVELSDVGNFALCLGELRGNKGALTLIKGWRPENVRLVVAGAPVETDYSTELMAVAAEKRNVSVLPRFLDVEEYNWLINRANCLAFPYLNFDAQSGVLAHAMSSRKPVVVANLPSLLEQVGAYEMKAIVSVGDGRVFAAQVEAIIRATPAPAMEAEFKKSHSTVQWTEIALALTVEL